MNLSNIINRALSTIQSKSLPLPPYGRGLGGWVFFLLLLLSCSTRPDNAVEEQSLPNIFPDYVGVTIPAEIAPMDFNVVGDDNEPLPLYVEVKGSKGGSLNGSGEATDFDIDEWHALTEQNRGGKLTFTVFAQKADGWHKYQDFSIDVSTQPMQDYGLTYRRIAPGYEVYSHMGLYQRQLSDFTETEIIDNRRVPGMCVNCHTANRTNPEQMLFHVRGEHGATALQIGDECEMLNTKNDSTIGFCVYPYWHPDGRYVAFSTNTTRQGFHVHQADRIEVFDLESDLQVYDTQSHTLIVTPRLKQKEQWETFPAFSPDGKTLYYCSTTRSYAYPDEFDQVRYNLYSIPFDAATATYGDSIRTLVDAERDSLSVSLPRPSYDGRWLMYTKANYGTFPVWHKEADLWLLDLRTGTERPMSEVNSSDTESFHNWNISSRWFVFCSRRGDGLYTRLYLSSIDDNGKATKPFLLPQRNPLRFYQATLYSYNTPDFTASPVSFDAKRAAKAIISPDRTDMGYKAVK